MIERLSFRFRKRRFLPASREEYMQALNALRRVLREKTFEAVWQEGAALTLEQALNYVLT